jgi:uncharacterized membrane protein YuzA (DUF378 family)
MKTIDFFAAVLLVVGGLNWGRVGFFGFDIVATALGEMSGLSRATYALVGLCAVYQALTWKEIQKRWALHWARY